MHILPGQGDQQDFSGKVQLDPKLEWELNREQQGRASPGTGKSTDWAPWEEGDWQSKELMGESKDEAQRAWWVLLQME